MAFKNPVWIGAGTEMRSQLADDIATALSVRLVQMQSYIVLFDICKKYKKGGGGGGGRNSEARAPHHLHQDLLMCNTDKEVYWLNSVADVGSEM